MPVRTTTPVAQEDEHEALPEPEHDKPLFTDEARFRISFFLHKSIKKASRLALTEDIESHGGCVVDTDEGVDTVLVAKDFPDRTALEMTYKGHSNRRMRKTFVEPSTFIRQCIGEKHFHHKRVVKGMGGKPPGRIRVEFTKDDDEKICEYLAKILPNKESGGRLGLKVYETLLACGKHNPVEYNWALHHTAESWKERYKKFAPHFDERISQLAKADPGVERAWPEDRQMSHKRLRGVIELDSDGEEVEEEEEEYVPASPPRRRRSGRSDLPPVKRARVSTQPHRGSRRQRPSATSNGKEKAVEDEDEEPDAEYEQAGTSLFSRGDLEDDLFGDFPSPDRTFADDGHAMHEYPTQDTLVGTAPNGDPSKVASTSGNRTRDGDLFPQPTSQRISFPRPIPSPRPHRRNMVYVDLRSRPVPRTQGSQPQPQSSPLRAAPESPQPTPPTPPPAQPSNAYKRPMKAARRPPEFVTQESSGPPPMVSPVAKRQQRKDKLKQVDMISKEVMEEDILVEENITPIGETLAEERDVENLLNAGNHEPSIIAPLVATPRARSMESDDVQVARNLREGSIASSRVAPPKGFSSRLLHPDDFLRQMGMSTLDGHRSIPFKPLQFGKKSPTLPQNEVSHHRPRPSEPLGLRRENPGIFKTPDPYTPQQRVRKGPGSTTSSAESFPLSGTHASAFKKKVRQLEKSSPYKPPAGTRAAKLAMNNPE